MGLSASQARLLSITARLSDNELHSQQIANSKVRLADSTKEASREYLAALDATKLMFNSYDAKGNMIKTNLTPAVMYDYAELKNQYGIVNTAGQLLVSSTDYKNYQASANLDAFLEANGLSMITNPAYTTALSNIYGGANLGLTTEQVDALKGIGAGLSGLEFTSASFGDVNAMNAAISGAIGDVSGFPAATNDKGIYKDLLSKLNNPPTIEQIDLPPVVTQSEPKPELLSIMDDKFAPIEGLDADGKLLDVGYEQYYDTDGKILYNRLEHVNKNDENFGKIISQYEGSVGYNDVNECKHSGSTTNISDVYEYFVSLERNLSCLIWGAGNNTGEGFAEEDGGFATITSSNGITIKREEPEGDNTALAGSTFGGVRYNPSLGVSEINKDIYGQFYGAGALSSTLNDSSANILLVDADKLAELSTKRDELSNMIDRTEEQQKELDGLIATINYNYAYNDFKTAVIDLYVNVVTALLTQEYFDNTASADRAFGGKNGTESQKFSIITYNSVTGEPYTPVESDAAYDEDNLLNLISISSDYFQKNMHTIPSTDLLTQGAIKDYWESMIYDNLETIQNTYSATYDYLQPNSIIDEQNNMSRSAAEYALRQAKYNEYYENDYSPKFRTYVDAITKYNQYLTQKTQKEEERANKIKEFDTWRDSAVSLINSCITQMGVLAKTPQKCYDSKDPKVQWYTNLWHRMNGESTVKDSASKRYKQLDDNLLTNQSWLQFALEHGVVTLEQVQYTDEDELGSGLKNAKWESTTYNSCSDISTVDDEIAVAKAEAEYQRKLSEIESKDKKYDNDIKKLDTEHNALQTEYESVKSVVDKNIERSFKAFS